MKTGLDEKCQARRHEVCRNVCLEMATRKTKEYVDVIKSIYKVVCEALGVWYTVVFTG
jgi:hypothetical protein